MRRRTWLAAAAGAILMVGHGEPDLVAGRQADEGRATAVPAGERGAPAGRWSVAQLSEGRRLPAAATVGDHVVFAGGFVTRGNEISIRSSVVDVYDGRSDQWTATTLSRDHSSFATAVVGSQALFAGGSANPGLGVLSAAVDIYDSRATQ